jgi:hypothetical protein
MVHAYLMYGFPTQTTQETIDSLEVVRQMMENGVIQSGFWHRFSMTAHSPVGKNPAKYQVQAIGPEAGLFANNDLIHEDPTGSDHQQFADGLSKAMFNYMHGVFFEEPVNYWFSFRTPRTTIPTNLIARALTAPVKSDLLRPNSRVLWLGSLPQVQYYTENKKGKTRLMALITFYNKTEDIEIKLAEEQAKWLIPFFPDLLPECTKPILLKELMQSFPASASHTFESFTSQAAWKTLRENGLVLV